MAGRLTRVTRVREVWSLNSWPANSNTGLQRLPPLQHLYASSLLCFLRAMVRGLGPQTHYPLRRITPTRYPLRRVKQVQLFLLQNSRVVFIHAVLTTRYRMESF